MRLLKRLLAGLSSIAIGLGIVGANAALPPPANDDFHGNSSYGADISGDELSSLLLDEATETGETYQVASRFKLPGERGRPALFGDPGKPVIGPPGQSGY